MQYLLRFCSMSLIIIMFLPAKRSWALSDRSFSLGIGYFSENSIGKITSSPTGEPVGTFGTISYPLILKYDWRWSSDYYFSPSLSYTLLKRKTAADSADVQLWHLSLPIGQNFSSSSFAWSLGPGILNRTITGQGGSVTLNNGTGTAIFGLPARSSTTQVLTVNGGINYSSNSSTYGIDLTTEGILTAKRTLDIMISYSYSFSRGY